tara:strand:+ start:7101 stop:7322 length:222 start_codon:yes stop_codon:yes gene_type:complete
MQSDVTEGVKQLMGTIKLQIEKNLNEATRRNMISVDSTKVPGLTKIINDAVDQGFVEGSDMFINALNAHAKNK